MLKDIDKRRLLMATESSVSTVQSLTRALALLEAVAQHGSAAAMTDLSRAVGLHSSTAFHLLRTLVECGFLTQEVKSRKYRIGPRLLRVAASATSRTSIAELAAPELAVLAAETGETLSIAVLERNAAVIAAKADGPGMIGVLERPGEGRPLHCTAVGKVLLAALPEAQAKAILPAGRLQGSTPRSITQKRQLAKELALVRSQGYALDDEEFSIGLRCLAAPVRSYSGQVVAALCVAGPAWRIGADRLPELVAIVSAAAERLSTQLGFLGRAN